MVLFAHCHLFVRTLVGWCANTLHCVCSCECIDTTLNSVYFGACMSVAYYFIMDIKYDWMRVCSTSLFHFVCLFVIVHLLVSLPWFICAKTIEYYYYHYYYYVEGSNKMRMKAKRKFKTRALLAKFYCVAVEPCTTDRIRTTKKAQHEWAVKWYMPVVPLCFFAAEQRNFSAW